MKLLLLTLVCVSASFAASYKQNAVDRLKNPDTSLQIQNEGGTDPQEPIPLVGNDVQDASA